MSEPSDPVRLAADPSAGKLGDWLRAGEQELPSDQQLSRLAQRLEPTFAAPVGSSASPLAGPVPKFLVGGLGIAGVALLALSLRGPREAPLDAARPSAGVSAPSATPLGLPTAATQAPALASADASAVVAPAPSASALSPAVSGAARARGASSDAERKPALSEAALLEQARGVLASDPARALALTQQHQARFSSGALKQEREVIAIEALRRLGRSQAASERASSFERAFPDSAHRRAVETGRPK